MRSNYFVGKLSAMMGMLKNLGLSEEQCKNYEIFHPYALDKTLKALQAGQRFVHYTSADTALKIIQNKEVWARKSSCMNDFKELEHGFECLDSIFKKHKEKFRKTFNSLFPNFDDRLIKLFNDWLPSFRTDTYITCMSEHDPSEDGLGRLSMWRAYGGSAGVAIVVNGLPFLKPTDALKAYTSPVAYFSEEIFEENFLRVLLNVEKNRNYIHDLGEDKVFAWMFHVFRTAMLCTKHPGFYEEREWRVIYSPSYERSERIPINVATIAGVPQTVCKIPLRDIPSEGLSGIEVPNLIDRIIIGPTQYPWEIRSAFISILNAEKVSNAEDKVIVSDIPLRE